MDAPIETRALLAEVDRLSHHRILALAAAFEQAESTELNRMRRAVARHFALTPETPSVIDILRDQLALSEAMFPWELLYALDEDTAYAARAAVLDMGLVASLASMPRHNAEALSGPWLDARRQTA